ncbi:hypothetical protein Hanom_Chr10g00920711 [Helianthus anomalus]
MYITCAFIHTIFVVPYTCRYGVICLLYTCGVEGINYMMMCKILTQKPRTQPKTYKIDEDNSD